MWKTGLIFIIQQKKSLNLNKLYYEDERWCGTGAGFALVVLASRLRRVGAVLVSAVVLVRCRAGGGVGNDVDAVRMLHKRGSGTKLALIGAV